jgi:hypothetical protein
VCDIGPFTKLVELPPLTVAPELSVNKFVVVVVRFPLVRVKVPVHVAAAFRITPALLLIVRLLRAVDEVGNSGPVVMELEPVYPTFTDVVDGVVLSDPPLREIVEPFPSVRVAEELVSVPLVRVRVPVTVGSVPTPRTTPVLLLIVIFGTVPRELPVTDWLPLPLKVIVKGPEPPPCSIEPLLVRFPPML